MNDIRLQHYYLELLELRQRMCPFPTAILPVYITDCVSYHSSVQLLKFADNDIRLGLVINSDKSEYHHEVNRLVSMV